MMRRAPASHACPAYYIKETINETDATLATTNHGWILQAVSRAKASSAIQKSLA